MKQDGARAAGCWRAPARAMTIYHGQPFSATAMRLACRPSSSRRSVCVCVGRWRYCPAMVRHRIIRTHGVVHTGLCTVNAAHCPPPIDHCSPAAGIRLLSTTLNGTRQAVRARRHRLRAGTRAHSDLTPQRSVGATRDSERRAAACVPPAFQRRKQTNKSTHETWAQHFFTLAHDALAI